MAPHTVVVGPAGDGAASSANGVGGGGGETGGGPCLLCYSPKVNNNNNIINSVELLGPLDPNFGAKVNANAWAVFVLRKVFRFTSDEVEMVLVKRGGEVEPAQWFLICDECVDWLGEFRGAVKEAKKGVPGAEEKVKAMRREVKEKLRSGLAGGGGDGDRRSQEVTDILGFLEREVEEEEEEEVVQPEEDEDEGSDGDDSEADHSSVSTGSISTSSHSSRIIEEALSSSSARNGASASANNKDTEAMFPNLLRLQQALTLLAEAAAVVEGLSAAQAEAVVAVPLPPPPPPAPVQNPKLAQLDGSSASHQVQTRDADAPQEEEDGVEVPLWRINVMEGYHDSGEERPILLDDDMSDKAFLVRHQICEAEEKRARRTSDVVPQESEPAVSPRLVDVEAIHVCQELPVDAFEIL